MSRKAFEMEHLSLKTLREENLEGRLLYCGLRETCNGRL
jgi:hypothetical protein